MNDIVKKAKLFAINAHFSTNHKYDDKEYAYHIISVYKIGKNFIHLIDEKLRDYVLAACYLHDCIEDCRLTYNDIKKEFGEIVAELVYALTNEKGKNRHERASDKYYNEMKLIEGAVYIKLCDRIANIEYSKHTKSRMYDLYKKENEYFSSKLYDEKYYDMFEYMKLILN